MNKILSARKIYVVCPASIKTGGPELLHQLVFTLNKNGLDASLVYSGIENHDYKIIDEYKQYASSYLLENEVEDNAGNLLVVPETNVRALEKYKDIQKAIWWLSVDNFYLVYFSFASWKCRIETWGFLRFLRRTLFTKSALNPKNHITMNSKIIQGAQFHFCQSKYAEEECKKHGLNTIYLSDYLNDEFFHCNDEKVEKENIVAYSPAKGFRFTKKIIKKNPDIRFEPIQKMTREQVQSLLKKAKVYIDFGNHPGKDRIPREARMQGCVVITGKNGSTKYFEDVPIDEKFERKSKNIFAVSNLIKKIFTDYDFYNKRQMNYTDAIRKEKEEFEMDVRKIFISNGGGVQK